ncbi:alpha-glucan family phosphorylase [filamentous cyanobacterium LEGE 11480]|uniref:Alpha-glucan family phosphorylase n=1 Tax=Romeriopsis navalis LEGE 11480 TaxID=2777977 RepID=A0A928Z3Z0_9CYAN|nr:alpha-glucan family phosphorylase [Romeriopsis navalis]MBE9031996.1 alpha-glucan family phosphorylase [Romeriopsis navalis LEGE 11480]
MSYIPVSRSSALRERLPQSLKRLAELAYNYWWSWEPEAVALFQAIDPIAWDQVGHNPVSILENVSYDRLTQLMGDPHYLKQAQQVFEKFDRYLASDDTWAATQASGLSQENPIAYFCAEFGVHESLPIYSGGLGLLAGDHLKSASELGIPLVAVGLMYRQGYFRQRLDQSGWQEDYYVDNVFNRMPLELVCNEQGEPITTQVLVRQRMVNLQIWQAQVGRVRLFLLDADRHDNDPIDRWLTGHLYGGNQETRIAQEIVLGIGGVRALTAIGIKPAIHHLNEGHAAFCLLEVCRQEMQHSGKTFYDVEATVREQCVFTTHTPVPAGHDVFSSDLMDSFFAQYWEELKLSREQFMALGARRLGDPWEPFGMTVLALRLCRTANGVSQLHGEVSRQMWAAMFPRATEDQVPIGYITNGVHASTWTAPLIADLYNEYLGRDWADQAADPATWAKVDNIPDALLWERHQILKERLVAHARHRVCQARQQRQEDVSQIRAIDHLLDPKILTIGFARRFSPYKRGDLLMRDAERMLRIFQRTAQPLQILFSGKAHPADEEGKRIIQRVMEWCKHPDIRDRVVFIEDYDIHIARQLVQGVDVWLNNPRRPLEASGTSGQKVCFNGGINCSVLDGWWCEGYQSANGKGLNGWAIGENANTNDQAVQDKIDSDSLYHLLETEIIPLYYEQDADGIPHGWIKMMKASIKSNCPAFNTHRMLMDYVQQVYLPTAQVESKLSLAKV